MDNLSGASRRTFQPCPATRAPGTCFPSQCAHWGRKQFHKSVNCPENPKILRFTQFFSFAYESRERISYALCNYIENWAFTQCARPVLW